MEDKEIIQKLKNDIVELKSHVTQQNKQIAKLNAHKNEVDKFCKDLVKRSKDKLEAFQKVHGNVIENVMQMVEKDSFVTLPNTERKKLVENEYKKIFLG